MHYLKKKPNILSLINEWLKNKKDYIMMSIPPRELNIRYNQFIRTSNPYCKENVIDYNNIVDHILQMSLPYAESYKVNNTIGVKNFEYPPPQNNFTSNNDIEYLNQFSNIYNQLNKLNNKVPIQRNMNNPQNPIIISPTSPQYFQGIRQDLNYYPMYSQMYGQSQPIINNRQIVNNEAESTIKDRNFENDDLFQKNNVNLFNSQNFYQNQIINEDEEKEQNKNENCIKSSNKSKNNPDEV